MSCLRKAVRSFNPWSTLMLWIFGAERCGVCLEVNVAPCKRCGRPVGVLSRGHLPVLMPVGNVRPPDRAAPPRFRLYTTWRTVKPQPRPEPVRKVVTVRG